MRYTSLSSNCMNDRFQSTRWKIGGWRIRRFVMKYLGSTHPGSRVFSVLLFSCLLNSSFALDKVPGSSGEMHLASLEWLPFVGPDMGQGGLSGAVAAAAASQIGYTVKIDYFPWKRAMRLGEEDPDFSGYFPSYYTEERARRCHFSAPMGHSTIGLAYLKSHPLMWSNFSDLRDIKIGVVAGYSNGSEFDELMKQGRLQTDPSPGDIFNLKKLLIGRVNAVVIDRAVLRYLTLTDPDLMKVGEEIVFHEKILAQLSLHICFKRTPTGLKLQQSFDSALKQLDINKIESTYFDKLKMEHKDAVK